MKFQFRPLIGALALLACSSLGFAQDMQVTRAIARATVPQQQSAGAWLTLANRGSTSDRLVAASTPVAQSVELHTMAMDGNVMRMREVEAIELAPAATLEMRPGDGYHLMLMGLKQPLHAGQRFPLTLQFEKAGKMEVEVVVDGSSGGHHRKH